MQSYAIKTRYGYLAVQGLNTWHQPTPDGWAEFSTPENAEAVKAYHQAEGEVVPVVKPVFSIGHDRNGNKICRVHVDYRGGFSVQTLDNLPETHRRGIGAHTAGEVSRHISKHGTARQLSIIS